MEKGALETKKPRRILTVGLAVLVIGLIAVILVYRGSLNGKVTGNAVKSSEAVSISESEAVTRLIDFLNKKYGDAKFFRSEDLGSIYLIVITHEKQNYDFFVTKDGKYFSNTVEKLEVFEGNVSGNETMKVAK